MKLSRSIVQDQTLEIFKQLVENGHLNVPFPISGRSDYWAQFYDGHPERCQIEGYPFVFLYGLSGNEERVGMSCGNDYTLTGVIGIQARCEHITAEDNRKAFRRLWSVIDHRLGASAMQFQLPGTYRMEGPNCEEWEYSQVGLGAFGYSNVRLLSGSPSQIENGKIKRYSASIELKVHFSHNIEINQNQTISKII